MMNSDHCRAGKDYVWVPRCRELTAPRGCQPAILLVILLQFMVRMRATISRTVVEVVVKMLMLVVLPCATSGRDLAVGSA
jgi:hypothetical protein